MSSDIKYVVIVAEILFTLGLSIFISYMGKVELDKLVAEAKMLHEAKRKMREPKL